MFGIIKKIFGTAQTRKLKKYRKLVTKVNQTEESYQKLSDDELVKKTEEFKKRHQKGESVDDLLVEAYGVVKNVCRRLCGTDIHVSGYDQKWDMIPYDVQILGAIAMHFGAIAEMQTGEGKTLTAAMPLYLNALTGDPVHLVTVNDYLAKRDCEWIGTIFRKLGLSVASLTNDIPSHQRSEIYKNDIVYGTASEFGFDYLRDNSMASSIEEQCQRRPYYFAIIDEVDSILIDEARTPLIISGPSSESRQMYGKLKSDVDKIVKMQRDFCNRLASEAKKTLMKLDLFSDFEEKKKLTKEEEEDKDSAFKKLWLVNKGTPRNKILKRTRENPDFRAEIDKWETYFYSEQNKQEKYNALSDLYIIVDERANEYELTDKGIDAWSSCQGEEEKADPFIMLDLGHEYFQIDSDKQLADKDKIEKKLAIQEEDVNRKERAHNLQQLFRAHLLMEKDVDYIVQENKIIIIDENTGRPQPGRRFSDGLHQSIEAKESVTIQGETQTYATITLQNYFRMYKKMAGMTGTAITEAGEFKEIYKLEVLEIPTYCPCNREDSNDEIYMTEREKYIAILKEIKKIHGQDRPILIGTESVEISEKLSRILKQNQLPHVVLNAKNHTREAEIIAEAGRVGSITLATNMAGRGTDIKLQEKVRKSGGLHVLGTTRHNSRRIDRQLRGRSGRLGDPGSSKFFVSFEDSLMRLFSSPRMTSMLQRFRPPEGEPISAKVLNKSIETAQKRVEQRNYMIRKHTLEYDDVMNRQRQEIYSFRNELIASDDPISLAKEIISNAIYPVLPEYFSGKNSENWNSQGFIQWLMSQFPISFEENAFENASLTLEEIEKITTDKILSTFDQKIQLQTKQMLIIHPNIEEEEKAQEIIKNIIRNLIIQKIDMLWKEHLLAIDHLRSDVNIRVVGQKDPLIEFKQEAFYLFDQFSRLLKLEMSRDLFRFELIPPKERKLQDTLQKLQMHRQRSFVPQPGEENREPEDLETTPAPVLAEKKIGRNEECPCGSGKKYKKCCGEK